MLTMRAHVGSNRLVSIRHNRNHDIELIFCEFSASVREGQLLPETRDHRRNKSGCRFFPRSLSLSPCPRRGANRLLTQAGSILNLKVLQ